MSDSSITRFFATDSRIANPKPVEMHTNAKLFIQDGEALRNRATAGQFFLFVHGIELALKSFLQQISCAVIERLRSDNTRFPSQFNHRLRAAKAIGMHRCEFCNLLHLSGSERMVLQRFAEAGVGSYLLPACER
jgi:hypothetical protein